MSWTTPAELRAQVQKLWDRGELLSSLATGAELFPKRLLLKAPTSAEIAENFEAVRRWAADLRGMPRLRLGMREFRHRVFGANALPAEVWLDSLDDALALLGKQKDGARFAALVELARSRQPEVLDWLARRPLKALELAANWSRLLDIVAWIKAHPRPGIYLRQVDIPGVHSKFIEAQRGVLAELLELALPPSAIDGEATGLSQFARRYGFLDKPERIRFRLLAPNQGLLPGSIGRDISLDAESFARLDCPLQRVFITENEINYLALPPMADSLAIFGAGYGFEALARAPWLSRCRIHYWGDIDTHGYAILDQLRCHFSHVESLLMDRATLLAFENLWGFEDKPTSRDLPRLNPAELALYNDLRDQRLGKNLRLEQERIGFHWVEAALAGLGNP